MSDIKLDKPRLKCYTLVRRKVKGRKKESEHGIVFEIWYLPFGYWGLRLGILVRNPDGEEKRQNGD